jgi:hypothetical protein
MSSVVWLLYSYCNPLLIKEGFQVADPDLPEIKNTGGQGGNGKCQPE